MANLHSNCVFVLSIENTPPTRGPLPQTAVEFARGHDPSVRQHLDMLLKAAETSERSN